MKKKLLLLSPDPRYTAVLDRHPCYLACNCGFNHVQTVQCTHDVIHRALIWHLSRVLLQNLHSLFAIYQGSGIIGLVHFLQPDASIEQAMCGSHRRKVDAMWGPFRYIVFYFLIQFRYIV